MAKKGQQSQKQEQDVLDGLLKATLPIIWDHHEVFKVKRYRDLEMLKYLPDGEEDSAEILLEGKWPIRVWKEMNSWNWLNFEFQNKNAIDEGIRRTNFHCTLNTISTREWK